MRTGVVVAVFPLFIIRASEDGSGVVHDALFVFESGINMGNDTAHDRRRGDSLKRPATDPR
jgi:hypothetical protein